ncbi:hypothetical protein Dimus_023286 [Dionaea muscipula]
MVIWEPKQMGLDLLGSRSEGLVRVGVVDPSMSNFCIPISELIGPDQQVEEVHLQNGSKEHDSPGRLVKGNHHSPESSVNNVPVSSERVESSFIPKGFMQGIQAPVGRREGDGGRGRSSSGAESISRGIATDEDLGAIHEHGFSIGQANHIGASVG